MRSKTPPPQLRQLRSVLVICHSGQEPYPTVVPNEVVDGFAATEVLLRQGYKRIAFIDGEMWMEATKDRLTGYRNALTAHDIPIDENLIHEGNFLSNGGHEQTKALLAVK